MSHLSAWNFDEGEEIIPGRYAASRGAAAAARPRPIKPGPTPSRS
jgi:hypothetical protein